MRYNRSYKYYRQCNYRHMFVFPYRIYNKVCTTVIFRTTHPIYPDYIKSSQRKCQYNNRKQVPYFRCKFYRIMESRTYKTNYKPNNNGY